MARPLSKLSAVEVTKQAEPGMYADGGGLYLRVGPTGGKSWVFRFMLDRRSHDMGLGAIHTITLKKARELAAAAREAVHDGDNPIDTRLVEKQRKKEERAVTFHVCATRYIAGQTPGWKGTKTATNWENTLTKPGHISQIHEILGTIPVREIDREMLLSIFTRKMADGRTLWQHQPVLMSELRRRIEKVLAWAKARGYRQGENPAAWKENLQHDLASPSKIHKVQHRATLGSYKDIGKVFVLVRESPSIGAPAGQFAILVACRVDAVSGAVKEEFELEKEMVWTVPATRLKDLGHDLRVPLSKPAVILIRRQIALSRNKLIFPGEKAGKPVADETIRRAIQEAGWHEHLTMHGFRATFGTWARDSEKDYREDIVEMALAHKVGNATYEAYQRGDLFNKRRVLMDDWAEFVLGSQVATTA